MRDRRPVDRRTWLVAAAAAVASPRPVRAGDSDDQAEAQAVIDRAAKAGLGRLATVRTDRYQAFGDAPEPYILRTVRDCEAVSEEFFRHYRAKGFAVAPPPRRMTVVALAGARSFARFLGTDPGTAVRGIYDRKANRLVVFDQRVADAPFPTAPAHANLFSLAHEATHQLTFNAGLLARHGDVPLCVVEGLGMYGEARRLDAPPVPGQLNRTRLDNLAAFRRRVDWLPLATLLTVDKSLTARGTDGAFLWYAQSWLLTYFLMTDPARLPGFRSYLASISDRLTPAHRLDDARAHLGAIEPLDDALQRFSIRLLKGER